MKMFKFLKEKLKQAVSQFADDIEEKGEEETQEEIQEEALEPSLVEKKPPEEPKEEKGFFKRIKEKITGESELEQVPEEELEEIKPGDFEESKEEIKEPEVKEEEKQKAEETVKEKLEKKETPSAHELAERKPEVKEKLKEITPKVEEEPKKEKSFFGKLKEKIVTKKINETQFDDLFWNLEVILLENNVAVEVIEKIKQDLKTTLVDKPIPRGAIEKTIKDSLKNSLESLFTTEKINVLEKAKEKKPLVICFVGINGSGKTTTIAKMTKLFLRNGLTCVLAAADTFRAAAIDQLQQHADNLGVKLIKHDYGSDAAAVAFDAVKHAEAKNIDVVLIDTAGRMHSNQNLMDEMDKIIRVANPDLKIFVGESITGNDCTEQAKKFNEVIGLDGIILSKADIDEKGGAAISISYITKKPILYIGTGQEYEDLKAFDKDLILESLEL